MNKATFYTEEHALEENRVSLQELSRRYVSGKKSELEFYIPERFDSIENDYCDNLPNDSVHLLTDRCREMYEELLANGVKPEAARSILPQSLYTTIWSAWQPSQFDSMVELRTDSHTQQEFQDLANAMNSMAQPEPI